MYPAFKSYFLSNSESNPRFKRLKKQSFVEVYHLSFSESVTRVHFSIFCREDPCIYAAHGQLDDFVLHLLSKFVRIDKIQAAKAVDKVNFEGENQQLKDRELFNGFATKQALVRLFNDGRKKDRLYQAVLSTSLITSCFKASLAR